MLISEHLLRAFSLSLREVYRGKIPKSPEPMVRGGAALGPLHTTKRNFVNSLSLAFTNTGLQGHFGGRTKELVVADMG
jgi:hypothetical protein